VPPLDDLYQLDPLGATSNSNIAGANVAELCLPSGINNAIRSLASMTIRAIGYQSAAISSSVSTNLATASSGLAVAITGANPISSFGLVPGEHPSAAVLRIVEFSSSASLSHSANLFLVGGVSRRTQPGDVGIYLHQGSSDRWKEITFSRADGGLPMDSLSVTTITNRSLSTSAISTVTLNAASASVTTIGIAILNSMTSLSSSTGNFGIIKYGSTRLSEIYVQTVRVSSAASASTSNNIPFDTSVPQNSEGENLFSLSITPRNSASIIEIEGLIHVSHASTGVNLLATLHLDNAAGAFASFPLEPVGGDVSQIKIYHEHTASTTSEHVYSLRYGAESGAMLINHGAGGNLGGTIRSWLRARERLG
jgi:hypothetical protein